MPKWLRSAVLLAAIGAACLGPAASLGQTTTTPATPTGPPAFQLVGASNITQLPVTVTGVLSNYHAGMQVTFHLDSPAGPQLEGVVSPSPVPANGHAVARVTLPGGMDNGDHDVYAVGVVDEP